MTTGLIYKKMANVYSKIEAIGKTQENKEQRFKFRGIDDVYNALHKTMAEEGIFLAPEVIETTRIQIQSKSGTNGWHTISKIKFTFFAEDGSSVSAVTEGEAIDYGDKSTSKSQSMAIKYALLQTFMIPTEDTDDGDKTSPEAGKHTPAVLKNPKGEIELPKGDHVKIMQELDKVKNEKQLKFYYDKRAKFTWTTEEITEQDKFVEQLKSQWTEAAQ